MYSSVDCIFIRPTKLGVLWYGAEFCMYVRKLVNTIQAKSFDLGLSDLVHILIMKMYLLFFKVSSRSNA